MKDGELPDDKAVEFDEETLVLTLPSGTYLTSDRIHNPRAEFLYYCSHVCATGAKIGHRSLLRYYKQRFGAQRALVPANQRAVGRVLKQYRALGWTGDHGEDFFSNSNCFHINKSLYIICGNQSRIYDSDYLTRFT